MRPAMLAGLRVGWPILTLLSLAIDAKTTPVMLEYLRTTVCDQICTNSALSARDLAVLQEAGRSPNDWAAFVVTVCWVTMLSFFAVGAVLYVRARHDPIALFAAYMLVLYGAALTPLAPTGSSAVADVALASNVIGSAGQAAIIFFLVFPDGRFVPRWTRYPAAAWVVVSFIRGVVLEWRSSPLSWLLFVMILLVVGAQIYRYRHVSTPRQRQQTRWVVFGFATALIGFFVALGLWGVTRTLASDATGGSAAGWTLALFLTYGASYALALAMPVSMAIAILRHQLYDIDLVINRTLVYSATTATLVITYALSVLASHALLRSFTQGSELAVAASTLMVAALVQPVRKRMQNAVDHRFYRSRYDAARTLEALAVRIRDEVDLDALRRELVVAARDAMQPAHANVWLRKQTE